MTKYLKVEVQSVGGRKTNQQVDGMSQDQEGELSPMKKEKSLPGAQGLKCLQCAQAGQQEEHHVSRCHIS
jgi:hypothetical protein